MIKYNIYTKYIFSYKIAYLPLKMVYFALKLEYFPRENASTGPIFRDFMKINEIFKIEK